MSTIPIPVSPSYTPNVIRYGISAEQCCVCATPSPTVTSMVHLVHRDGVSYIATLTEQGHTLGLWPVCDACQFHFPAVRPFVVQRSLGPGESNLV